MVVLPAPPFWLRRLMPAYARLAMYDDAGRQYFAIGGELRPARVRDDVYLHIEAGTAPTCPGLRRYRRRYEDAPMRTTARRLLLRLLYDRLCAAVRGAG